MPTNPDDDDPESQATRRRVLHEQASTLSQHAQSDAETPRGRFTETEKATVIGVAPPSYPQLPASSPWSGSGPQPPAEPPLGFSVNEMPEPQPTADASADVATGEPMSAGDAPSSSSPLADVQRPVRAARADVGSPFSSDGDSDDAA